MQASRCHPRRRSPWPRSLLSSHRFEQCTYPLGRQWSSYRPCQCVIHHLLHIQLTFLPFLLLFSIFVLSSFLPVYVNTTKTGRRPSLTGCTIAALAWSIPLKRREMLLRKGKNIGWPMNKCSVHERTNNTMNLWMTRHIRFVQSFVDLLHKRHGQEKDGDDQSCQAEGQHHAIFYDALFIFSILSRMIPSRTISSSR